MKQLSAFAKKKLRALGALHAALQEKTMGLSRGLSDRRGERMTEANLELVKAQQALDRAERYAADTKNDAFRQTDLPRIRKRHEDAKEALEHLKAEATTIEAQLEASRADSDASGRVFQKLLKHAEAS